MQKIPLILGVSRQDVSGKSAGGNAPGSPDSRQKLPKELKQKIFERDNFTCGCCGFKSVRYQEILVRNHNYNDLSENNLATTCIFCHQCFNLTEVSAMRSGVLLWLPEIAQAGLHHIARAVYVARISQGPAADASRKCLDTLMTRRDEVRRRIGTDDPYILATVLSDYLGDKHYHYREKKLGGIRLFPLDRRIIREADLEFNQFPQILAYWRSKDGPFGGKPPTGWISIYHQIAGTQAGQVSG